MVKQDNHGHFLITDSFLITNTSQESRDEKAAPILDYLPAASSLLENAQVRFQTFHRLPDDTAVATRLAPS